MDVRGDLVGRRFPALNGQGFVALVDVMGDDSRIVEAARLTRKGARKVQDDRGLIRYLMRNRHTTPFEFCVLTFHVRVPMDCWRQWIRHRMSSTNEYSTRYSEAIDDRQTTPPDGWRAQATGNRQGSTGMVESWPQGISGDDPSPGDYLSRRERDLHEIAAEVYQERLRFGVAREQARKDLPLSTFTEAYWKIDLHNLFHFLGLRMDPHAQQEIREYATIMGQEIVAKLFPLAWEAFQDFVLGAVTLSGLEIETTFRLNLISDDGRSFDERFWAAIPDQWRTDRSRERDECRQKLVRLGLGY